MNYINRVYLRDDNKLMIHYLEKYEWFDVSNDYFGCVVYRVGTSGPEPLTDFSKEQLTEYQNVILNAYIYQYDLLDEGIQNNLSKKELDGHKFTLLTLRKLLRMYTNYINSYDEILKEYENL